MTTVQDPPVFSVLLAAVKALLEELDTELEGMGVDWLEDVEEGVITVVEVGMLEEVAGVEETRLEDVAVHPTVYVVVIELGHGCVVPDCAATTQG